MQTPITLAQLRQDNNRKRHEGVPLVLVLCHDREFLPFLDTLSWEEYSRHRFIQAWGADQLRGYRPQAFWVLPTARRLGDYQEMMDHVNSMSVGALPIPVLMREVPS